MAHVQVAASLSYSFADGADAESDVSSIGADVVEDDLSFPIEDLIEERQLDLDDLVDTSWTLGDETGQAVSGRPIREVQDPTASKISCRSLHPAVYRYMEPFSDLHDVAQRLGVFGWREEADRIWPAVERAFDRFVGLPNTAYEIEIQGALFDLIRTIAEQLNRSWTTDGRKCALVRGTLALDHLAVRGVVGLFFCSDSEPLLAAEVKTAKSWELDDTWYVKSRGTQLFQTLYAANCPTLLLTQEQFRLFFENDRRTRVCSYPSEPIDDDALDDVKFNATLCTELTGNALFHTLVVCLMRAARKAPAVASGTKTLVQNRLRDKNVTAETKATLRKRARASRASARDRRTRARTANRDRGRAAPLASFFTGVYDANGEPVFRTVHAELFEQVASDSSESDESSSLCGDKVAEPHQDSAVVL